MAKRAPSSRPRPASKAVTAERAARLCRLVRLLGTGPQPRERLMRRLRLDIRSFYRDLELVRAAGVAVWLVEGNYVLEEAAAAAVARLPFPDPHLTLGEAQELAKGRGRTQQKLKAQLAKITRD
jgi:predicted DNA-binding transcriptional regulator YafY